jgi:deoxyribodipyrimidine photolyase-related protein
VSFVCGTIRLFLTARTHEVEHIIITELGEHSVLMEPQSWAEIFDLPAFIRPDAQFLCDHAECESWSAGRESLRMECSYRHMRKKYFVLMAGDQLAGGQRNVDSDNRKPSQPSFEVSDTFHKARDVLSQDVPRLLETQFLSHMGDTSQFYFAVIVIAWPKIIG